MIIDSANKTRFREDIHTARSGKSAHESLKGVRGKSVGASELGSWKSNLTDPFTAKPGFFLTQVVGESMNRRVTNGWLNPRNPTFSKAANPKRFHSKGGNIEMRHLPPFDPIYIEEVSL